MNDQSALLAHLPPIFWHTVAGAPLPSMRCPYRAKGVVCSTNGIVAVLAPVGIFRPGAIAGLRRRPTGCPDVDRLLRRWRGDGRSHRLPGWDDADTHSERSAVRVGWTPLMRRWVAFLLTHDIRRVHTGRSADDPVRFDAGPYVEGLLMPVLCRPKWHPK